MHFTIILARRSEHTLPFPSCNPRSLNTFRLWMPQLFTIIEEYEADAASSNGFAHDGTLCDMLAYKVNKSNALLLNGGGGAGGGVSSTSILNVANGGGDPDVLDMNKVIFCEAVR